MMPNTAPHSGMFTPTTAPVGHGPRTPAVRAEGVGKRAFDVGLSGILFVFTLPVVLVAAVLVRATSRGPAIYAQTRLGRGGVPFTIYKLRTMAHDCEKGTGPRWSVPGDPRVTPVGRVLRKLHIDELPQLWNVLRGDMSLVGPRPERPAIAADLEVEIPDFAARLAVRPGVTGLAQVQFPPDVDIESVRRKLAADLRYVRASGGLLDARIFACTALHLLRLPHAWRRLILGRYAATPEVSVSEASVLAPQQS